MVIKQGYVQLVKLDLKNRTKPQRIQIEGKSENVVRPTASPPRAVWPKSWSGGTKKIRGVVKKSSLGENFLGGLGLVKKPTTEPPS